MSNHQQPHQVTPSSPPSSTQSSQVNHQSQWDPSLPRNRTYLDTDYTVVSTTNSLSHLWTQLKEFHEPTDSNWDSVVKSGMCFGNRTQRTSNPLLLWGNTAITLICQKPLRDPILPMFSLCLSDVGVWDSSFEWISVFLGGIRENNVIEMRILWTSLHESDGVGFSFQYAQLLVLYGFN